MAATVPDLARGTYRYARWDGTQRLPDLSADDLLDALSDDLMADGDLSEALRRLLSRGLRPNRSGEPSLSGLDQLMARLDRRRRELLERHQLGDVLAEVREELEEIVGVERRGIERRMGDAATAEDADADLRSLLSDMAARRQAELEALPEDVGERIGALRNYDFLEPAARERFDALMDRLGQQVLDSWFEGLSQRIRDATPDDLKQSREMVRELEQLLRDRLEGHGPEQAAVDDFLTRHGDAFPGAATLDDVIEQLASRMAAMQSLLASMSPAQRDELRSLMDALLRDDRLRWDLAQLASTLDQLLPSGLGERMRFSGDEPLSLEGALAQLDRLAAIDRLSDQLAGAADTGELGGIDREEVKELLDADSAQELAALQQLAQRLEEAGLAVRHGDRLELTARGARRIGQKVLDALFGRLRRDVFGGHPINRAGLGGEAQESAVAYEFGRPFHLDLQRSLGNALAREENRPGVLAQEASSRRPALVLDPADFMVRESAELTSTATVLLLDMSRSMLLRGCFMAAKKVALSLDTLIRTRYPRDRLHVIGFAYHAREIRPGALATLSWNGYEYGTNLQHGLMLARQLLARSHATNREVVVITDGEPTAHFEDGRVEFSYPPTARTIRETLKEVGRCTREGVTINTFMLERSRALTAFVDRMTRLNHGRAFYATPERLGEYVLVDYVGRRSKTS